MAVDFFRLTMKPSTTDWFFDRARVQKAADQQKRRQLSRWGAFIRRSGRDLLGPKVKRAAPRPSPGAPRTREGEPNLKTIFFAWDPSAGSVVVGPVKLGRGFGGKTVPQIHEEGGFVESFAVEKFGGGRDRRGRFKKEGFRLLRDRRGKPIRRRVRLPRRPFMGPALDENLDVAPRLWRDAIRPGS